MTSAVLFNTASLFGDWHHTPSYIDGMGVKSFVALCEKLAAAYGDHFKPTALLQEMAAKNETFYTRFDPYAGEQKAA